MIPSLILVVIYFRHLEVGSLLVGFILKGELCKEVLHVARCKVEQILRIHKRRTKKPKKLLINLFRDLAGSVMEQLTNGGGLSELRR